MMAEQQLSNSTQLFSSFLDLKLKSFMYSAWSPAAPISIFIFYPVSLTPNAGWAVLDFQRRVVHNAGYPIISLL